jgi:hypothetical protein
VDYFFEELELGNEEEGLPPKPDCFAVRQYKKYKLAAGKTAKSILISCGARLAVFDIKELRDVICSKRCKWNAPKKHRQFKRLRHTNEPLPNIERSIPYENYLSSAR